MCVFARADEPSRFSGNVSIPPFGLPGALLLLLDQHVDRGDFSHVRRGQQVISPPGNAVTL
jgi:hypothetical protein